jgi:hypothetical protein
MAEMVKIHLWSYFDKITLKNAIDDRVKELGLGDSAGDLDLGFELPYGWPVDKDCEVTLAQLVVLGQKLKLRITITRLSVEPMEKEI